MTCTSCDSTVPLVVATAPGYPESVFCNEADFA